MLYLTTREKYDAFTAARTTKSDRGPNGGFYLPYKMPNFSREEMAAMKDRSFGQNMAELLNQFFATRFTAWDVEFCIGRYPMRLASMGQKVLVAECWRNLEGNYERMERQVAALICGCSIWEVRITSWLRIGIRIAFLFATYAEMLRQEMVSDRKPFDVAVSEGNLSLLMAVWYAKAMGLPVANIICGCNDGSATWDLVYNGQIRPGDREPVEELERLVFDHFGFEEAARFVGCLQMGENYEIPKEGKAKIQENFFAAVVSHNRMESVILNAFRTSSYIMGPDAAVSYSALMDHRARTGEGRVALLLADRNAGESSREVAAAMGVTEEKLKELLGR